MDTTGTRSPVRRWAARIVAIGALTTAFGATYVLVLEATDAEPPPPVPADLAR